MKRWIGALALLLCLLTGCQTREEVQPNQPTEAAVVDTTQPDTEPTQQPVALADVDTPKTWLANCEEYIGLRIAPDGESVQRILKGESVQLLSWDGRYAYVDYQGQKGYVMSSYIIPQDGLTPLGLQIVLPTDIYTHQQMMMDMQALTAAYPNQLEMEVIGTSVLGREIPVLRLGNTDAAHHVLLQGAIHGREHMNSWLLMTLAEYWLARWEELGSDVCYHIIPMVNPDGVTISQTGHLDMEQQMIFLRDSELGLTASSRWLYAQTWKANALGTDLNRNFPADWERLTEIAEPSAAGYHGQYPFSAPESAALRYYTLRWGFDVTVSYHSSGSLIYWQYGDKQPVNDLSYSLAQELKAVSGYTPTRNYDNSCAGYKDWVMDSLGIPSVTIEIGCGDSPLHQRELYSIFYRNYKVLPAIADWLAQ